MVSIDTLNEYPNVYDFCGTKIYPTSELVYTDKSGRMYLASVLKTTSTRIKIQHIDNKGQKHIKHVSPNRLVVVDF